MSISVRLYKGMTKDISSTKQPALGNYTDYTDYDCELFDPCSITHPRIWLAIPVSVNLAAVNYAYISDFARYYWVSDASFVDGRWLFSLDVDVLATYKTVIGSTPQYVVRSYSHSDGSITDTAYPVTGNIASVTKATDAWTSEFKSELNDGMYIVGIVGNSDSNAKRFGAVNYYGFKSGQFADFITALMSNSGNWLGTGQQGADLTDATTKLILNPMQYITTCAWFPLSYTYGTTTSDPIPFGWWSISGVSHLQLPEVGGIPATSGSIRFNISNSRHPQAATRGAFLNRDPYAEYSIYIPQLGSITLPTDVVAKVNSIVISYTVDYPTGNALFYIKGAANADGTGTGYDITRSSAKLSIDVPIAQITVDTVGAAQSAVGTVGGAIANGIVGNIVGLITGLVQGGIDTTIKATQPIPNIISTVGSVSGYQLAPQFIGKFKYIADEARSLIGRPYCKETNINNLSGYVLCASRHIAIPGATKEEIESVESYLTGGFHYE